MGLHHQDSEIETFLAACRESAPVAKSLELLREEARAQHAGFGAAWGGRMMMPVLTTLPPEYLEYYLGRMIDRQDPMMNILEARPGSVAFPGPVPLADFEAMHRDLFLRFDVVPPSSGHSMVGPFGTVCGVVFFGLTPDEAPERGGSISAELLSRRGVLARRFYEALMKLAPVSWPRRTVGPRVLECLHLGARGLSNAEIARALDISERTVSEYFDMARSRLGGRNRVATVARAVSLGIIRPRSTGSSGSPPWIATGSPRAVDLHP